MKKPVFDALPPELKIESAKELCPEDLISLAKTSKKNLTLFQPLVDEWKSVYDLLDAVVRGEHEAVSAFLVININLVIKRGKVTDCSGRVFGNISPFEYALWARDAHMWRTMLECIPKNEKGKQVVAQLISQYDKINVVGVTYTYEGETKTEKHFDFENTIFKEMQLQINSVTTPGEKDQFAIDTQWRKGVGGAQRMLPLHVIDEYCDFKASFLFPMIGFARRPQSTRRIVDGLTGISKSWFEFNSRVGSDFALFRGAKGCIATHIPFLLDNDLAALKALFETRTKDFINLHSQLEEWLKDNLQPQSFRCN